MMRTRRSIARWTTQWLCLFIGGVFGLQFVRWSLWVELPLLTFALLLAFVRPPQTQAKPVDVASPLGGTRVGLNSPADKVPSHGVRSHGQA